MRRTPGLMKPVPAHKLQGLSPVKKLCGDDATTLAKARVREYNRKKRSYHIPGRQYREKVEDLEGVQEERKHEEHI